MYSSALRGSDELVATLSTKPWFGFDLDDTLHEFRKASRAATTFCLSLIAQENPQVSPEALQERYQQVLKEKTASAFVDGKTSHDYRRERFSATLDHFDLGQDAVDQLLEAYERILVDNLALKPGALQLLRAVKASGRKIVVITEGPQDAQERALRDLGIAQYVDFLATTNHFGAAKTDGIFPKVLNHLGIRCQDIAYIGDSLERDVVPAAAEGIFVIHLNEKQPSTFTATPITINSLAILEGLLPPLSQA